MRKSARILGQEYGLTAQEMNCVLKDAGYLEGSSGNYYVTEKGLPFAEEKDFHRGTGGYAHYNRYWTTRTWDESIADELHIDDVIKKKARDEVASIRQQQREEMMAAREEANARFLASQNNENSDTENPNEGTNDGDTLNKVLIVGGLIAIGYGIYKVAPHVVNWWNEKVSKKSKDKAEETNNKEKFRKMICPACGDTMTLTKNIWNCNKCSYSISDKQLNDGEVFWFCDRCEAFMNVQLGFTTRTGNWICTCCGLDNDVTETNIE